MQRFDTRLAHYLGSVIYCGSLFALAVAVGLAVQHVLGAQNVLLVFLPVVLLAAVKYGFWMASCVSVGGVLATSYFFAAPLFSFAVSDPGNVWALAVFLVAAGLTSRVAAQARQRAEAISYHNRVLEELYAVTSNLAGVSRRADLVEAIVRHAETLLGVDVVLLEPDDASSSVLAQAPRTIELGKGDLALARDCMQLAQAGEIEARSDSVSSWQFRPILIGDRAIAALGMRARTPSELTPPAPDRLIDLLIEQIGINFERIRLADEMQRAEMLAETEKLRTALLTSISHDLKTPLASILGNVTSLRRYGHLYDDETRFEMLDQAETETLRLNRFVDNLLHMTRLEAGALKPTFELIDMDDAIGSALQRLERALEKHVVRVRVDESVPMLMLDFVLTEQVIANLLDNAAKYSAPGTVIDVTVSGSAQSVLLTVRDEGLGVPSVDAARIFDRFFRVETPDRRRAGAGLGLAICKGFAEAMGGRIGVANRLSGKGAEFTVEFPVRQSKQALR